MDKAGKKGHKAGLMSQSDISKVFDEYTKTFESLLALAEEQEKSGAIDIEYQDLYMKVFEGYILRV